MFPKTRKLANGLKIPLMGLGTSRIEMIIWSKFISTPADVVYESIKSGVRLIDTAYKYGNEEIIGQH